jgi:aryl-alcohol dehydrogenase-like predicted oxidoreductase
VIRVLAAGAASAQLERAANAGDPGGAMAGSAGYEANVERAGKLAALARELGLESSLELAVRFGLSKPGVSTVLVGYSNFGHLVDAIRGAERGPLPADAVQRVLAFV